MRHPKSIQIFIATVMSLGLSTSLLNSGVHHAAAEQKTALAPPPSPTPPQRESSLRGAFVVSISGPEAQRERTLAHARAVAQRQAVAALARRQAAEIAQRALIVHQMAAISRSRTVHRHVAAASITRSLVTAQQMIQWSRVAMCEEGGHWHVIGSKYSGGLGITNLNWLAYGGGRFASNAGLATPEEQVYIAIRIQSTPPDQNGCSGSW